MKSWYALFAGWLKRKSHLQAPDKRLLALCDMGGCLGSKSYSMPFSSVLCLLALLPLQGAFQEASIESVTLVQGQSLDLDCAVAGGRRSFLEWKNPHWFVIFFQNLQGLKDQRYELIHYSKDELHIRLSRVTTDDEGLYTCFHNGVPVKRKQVNVLAMPSHPLLEASRNRVQSSEEEKVVLKCSVWGSKPPPQMTWLLDNGMEIFGETKHHLQGHRKTYNSTSTLTVLTYNQNSAVTCVIRHKSLRGGNLTTSFHFEQVEPTRDFIPITPEFSTTTLKNPQNYAGSDKTLNDTEGRFPTQTPSPANGTATLIPNMTKKTSNISNVTEGISHLQTASWTSEGTIWDSSVTSGTDLTFKEMVKKKSDILFPVLVSVLLSALFIVVLLFVVKLWKAHKVWKKENEASEQSLENNRPRINDVGLGQEKRTQTACWKVSKKYVVKGSWTRSAKHSEESQDSSVFEKQLPRVKETDL